jgi:hypothetical protein
MHSNSINSAAAVAAADGWMEAAAPAAENNRRAACSRRYRSGTAAKSMPAPSRSAYIYKCAGICINRDVRGGVSSWRSYIGAGNSRSFARGREGGQGASMYKF